MVLSTGTYDRHDSRMYFINAESTCLHSISAFEYDRRALDYRSQGLISIIEDSGYSKQAICTKVVRSHPACVVRRLHCHRYRKSLTNHRTPCDKIRISRVVYMRTCILQSP